MPVDPTPHWTIMVCPECGRDDRWSPFGAKAKFHSRHGVQCFGVPVEVTVVPASALDDLREQIAREVEAMAPTDPTARTGLIWQTMLAVAARIREGGNR